MHKVLWGGGNAKIQNVLYWANESGGQAFSRPSTSKVYLPIFGTVIFAENFC
jgi:hypothetical protein